MPKTESSPLTIVQKQADVIKKAVEKLIKECNKVIKDKKLKDKDVKFKQLYKECYQSKKDVKSVHGRAEALIEEDEPKKVKNYSNKRDFEVNRLFNLEKQLNELMPKLCPDEDEETFVKQLKEAGELSDEPVNEDGDDDDDDDEREDEVDNAKGLEAITEEDENISESQEEEKIKDKDIKDDGKKDKKDKKDKKKDKDKKKKDKTSKDDDEEDAQKDDKDDEEEVEKDKGKKDKKNKDKNKKSKDKTDKDKSKDKEYDIENKDKDDKKKKDKKKDKDKDKKEKDLEKEKKEKDKKGKDKKDKDKKSKEKDAKDDKKNKDDEDKKKKVIEVPKEEELEDFEDSEYEDDSEEDDDGIAEDIDEDIDEEIDGDDEESDEDSEEEDARQKIVQHKSKVVEQQMIKKQDIQQQQAKPSPKDEIENLQSMDYDDDDESEEEESEDDDVADNKIEQIEDVIVPHSSASVQSAPVPKKTSPRVTAVPKKDSPRVAAIPKKDSPKVAEKEEEDDDDEYEDDEEDEEDEEDEDDEENENDDGEEEESEEEEDDEAGDNTLEITQPTTRFVAIDDFEAAEDGDLSVKQGEIIHIVEVREDGWWVGENEKGEKGLVPKTYLQMYNQYKDIQQQDEGDETKEHDNESEEEGEGEGHKEKEDGDDEQQTPSKRRSGRQLWGSVKKTVNETLVSDVLHAMGAGPSGFRLPTLSKYFNESNKFRMQNFLTPKLSTSNLGFRDLFVNPASGQMRPTEVRVERVITISSCQQIPPPAAGIIVQRRYVRMCLFDGQNVLSNIHTVRVAAEDKTERNWSFNSRITDSMDVQLHNELFVRTNSAQTNVGILFELCISCVKSKTEERGEFSCGWAHLPLTDKTGLPIPSKSCDLYVNGGTPYERDIEVDPSVSRRASSNALVSLISGNKQPRLLVKVGLPNKEQKAQLDLLPETLVGDICLLPFYTYYRQILADMLVIQRLDLDSTEPIHSPFLHQFPQVADHPDLMSLLRETWVNKLKSVKRAERSKVCTVTGFDILASFFISKLRDVEVLKKLFEEVFMESVYPVISASSFVRYKTGNTDIEMKRKNTIEKFSQVKRERKSALAALLASDIVYTPFDMSEVTFNVVNSYSLYETFVPVPVEG